MSIEQESRAPYLRPSKLEAHTRQLGLLAGRSTRTWDGRSPCRPTARAPTPRRGDDEAIDTFLTLFCAGRTAPRWPRSVAWRGPA